MKDHNSTLKSHFATFCQNNSIIAFKRLTTLSLECAGQTVSPHYQLSAGKSIDTVV